MKSLNKQQGFTLLTWLVIISVVVFNGMIVFKLVPIYLRNYSVRKSLAGMEAEKTLANKDNMEIRTALGRRFYINEIRDLDPKKLKIKKENNKAFLSYHYEARVNMIGNADVLVTFDETAVIDGKSSR